MQTKQFTGATIDDVLVKVRAELGEDAMILETRRVVSGGLGGFFGREMVEVTASDGDANREAAASVAAPLVDAHDDEDDLPAYEDPFARHLQGRLSAAREAEEAMPAGPAASPAAAYARNGAAPFASGDAERTRAILEAARSAVRDAHDQALLAPLPEPAAEPAPEPAPAPAPAAEVPFVPVLAPPAPEPAPEPAAAAPVPWTPAPAPSGAPAHPGLAPVRDELVAAGVDAGQLDLFLEGFERAVAPFLGADDPVREAVSDYIVARLPTVRDHRRADAPRTIAFVGQSGVGKSSAAAGLAARYRAAGVTVALVAAGAEPAEVLQANARRHDVQLFHAADGPALRTLLGTLADRDLIIIDTDGRSHTQTAEMVALGVMLGGVDVDEVHLVAAAATPLADLADVFERFAPVGVNRITMTKIDETRFPGNLVNAPLRVGVPLGYLSSGTVVPDALVPADARRVAELLLP